VKLPKALQAWMLWFQERLTRIEQGNPENEDYTGYEMDLLDYCYKAMDDNTGLATFVACPSAECSGHLRHWQRSIRYYCDACNRFFDLCPSPTH
jgi:hypothetical protein